MTAAAEQPPSMWLPHLGPEVREAADRALAAGYLGLGSLSRQFKEALAGYLKLDDNRKLMTISRTAALNSPASWPGPDGHPGDCLGLHLGCRPAGDHGHWCLRRLLRRRGGDPDRRPRQAARAHHTTDQGDHTLPLRRPSPPARESLRPCRRAWPARDRGRRPRARHPLPGPYGRSERRPGLLQLRPRHDHDHAGWREGHHAAARGAEGASRAAHARGRAEAEFRYRNQRAWQYDVTRLGFRYHPGCRPVGHRSRPARPARGVPGQPTGVLPWLQRAACRDP